MNRIRLASTAALSLALLASASAQLLNGSFETPAAGVTAPTDYYQLVAGNSNATDIADWTLTTGQASWCNEAHYQGIVEDGSYSVELGGPAIRASLNQTFATTADTTYNVTFWSLPNIQLSATTVALSLEWLNGAQTLTQPLFYTQSVPEWQKNTFQFTTPKGAIGATSTLVIMGATTGSNSGPFVDNFSVNAVAAPGPAPAASFLGVLGLLWRRKRG